MVNYTKIEIYCIHLTRVMHTIVHKDYVTPVNIPLTLPTFMFHSGGKGVNFYKYVLAI